MTLVYTAQDLAMVSHLRNLLDLSGVVCHLRNVELGSGVGGLPPIECWPELWVENDSDVPQAQALIESAFQDAPQPLESWTCPRCGEQLEGQFTECWHCGTSRAE